MYEDVTNGDITRVINGLEVAVSFLADAKTSEGDEREGYLSAAYEIISRVTGGDDDDE